MSVFLYLIVSVVTLAYFFVYKRSNYFKNRGFQGPDFSFPFGSLKGVGTKISRTEAFDVFYKKFKGKTPAAGIFFFFSPVVMPIDPDLVKNILVKEFSSFTDRGFYYNSNDVSANILTLEGPEWRKRRVKLTPIFTSGKMKLMYDIVDEISNKLIKVIKKDMQSSNVLEMKVLATKYTSDVIGSVAFGLDCQCLEDPDSEFMRNGRRVLDLTPFEILKFFFASGFPDFCRKLNVTSFPHEPMEFFHKRFIETLEYREKNNIKRNDFVSLLLALKEFFTPDELAAESFLVYVAGFETSSTLMNFSMYELALNPDVQDKLRDELKSTAFETDGKLTYDLLTGMKYLDMVMNESLRKYPPIPSMARKCTKDYEIPGTKLRIEKGTLVEIPVFSLHHDSEYFPDPEKFDPERFSPENVKSQVPFTFLPFGEGPRNCLGLRFGLMQAKLAIAKLIQNFELSASDKTPIPMKFHPSTPFLGSLDGMHLKLKKIDF